MIGLLVGVVPVALGLAWLPSLRRASPQWLAAFMALTAGLLTFLAFEALAEAFDLQAALPSGIGGVGLVLLGVTSTYLFLTLLRGASERVKGPSAGSRSRRSSPSASACTTSARGSRSARRSRSASLRSGRSSSSASWSTT